MSRLVRTSVAMMNPHGTLDHVFADVADRMSEGALLLGVKNTRMISRA